MMIALRYHMQNNEPKLQAAGAGLPFLDQLFTRYYVGPFLTKKKTWEQNAETFEIQTKKIQQLYQNLNYDQMNKRILVDPIKGIEDSSRNWSIAMTLEHMMIVGKNVGHIAILLSEEKLPPIVVDIAKVKPHPELDYENTLKEFNEFHHFAQNTLQKIKNRHSKTTLVHPWFGKFTSQQWFWLLGAHQGIHLKQVRQIIEKLN